jgi:hypothetical protein
MSDSFSDLAIPLTLGEAVDKAASLLQLALQLFSYLGLGEQAAGNKRTRSEQKVCRAWQRAGWQAAGTTRGEGCLPSSEVWAHPPNSCES